jgi:hypothetical protein
MKAGFVFMFRKEKDHERGRDEGSDTMVANTTDGLL